MICFVTILILVLVCALLGFITYNLLAKVDTLLKYVEEQDKELTSALNVVSFVHGLVAETFATMITVDKRGGFSSDDEVGFAFKAIYESIQHAKVSLDKLTKITDSDRSGGSTADKEGKE